MLLTNSLFTRIGKRPAAFILTKNLEADTKCMLILFKGLISQLGQPGFKRGCRGTK